MELTNIIQNLTFWFSEHGIKVILIFLGAIIVNRFLKFFIKKGFEKQVGSTIDREGKKQRIKTIINVFDDIIGYVVWAVAILIILPELEIETAPLITGLGVIGLSFSFVFKELIQDFIRGFFIISEDQYRIGDFVKIAGMKGKVKNLNFRTTILQSKDGSIHIIPNREIKIVSKKNK